MLLEQTFVFVLCVCVKWEEGVEIPTDINLTVRSTVSEMSDKLLFYRHSHNGERDIIIDISMFLKRHRFIASAHNITAGFFFEHAAIHYTHSTRLPTKRVFEACPRIRSQTAGILDRI